jgi:hypothetical protein
VSRSGGKGTRKPGKEKKMVQSISIDDLKSRIDDEESFILINATDNVSVCLMNTGTPMWNT